MSRAYHQKVAKDRATKEGIVVNPPELGNLPGQGEVTYASQVQDVLIPYTTREDTYNYYEERNYVNDVNREHTEVLETYDHDGKARETYSYGQGRASYLNNQTGDSYNYLTNQSGSVTGLTKDGQAVASSSYNLYGARKTSTDTTGQPFAYNGEARDDTGLDYLRARYYDSQGGTFLTEDSYPGEDTDPLSQNLYSYVQNNPVNYTDPSGHRMVWMGGEGEPSRPRSINTRLQRFYQQSIVGQDALGRAVSLHEYTDRRIQTDRNFRAPASYYQAFGPNVATYQGGSYGGQSSYAYAQQQAARARAQAEQRRRQQIRYEYGLATGIKSSPTIREGLNLLRNWNTALQNTLKHVCNPKTTKGQDDASKKKLTASELRQLVKKANSGDMSAVAALSRSYDGKSGIGTGIRTKEEIEAGNKLVWENTVDGLKKIPYIIGEFFSVNDTYRLTTGKDPETGENASRIEAAGWLLADIVTLKTSKVAKGAKAASKGLQALDALNDASKVAKVADKVKDVSKATKTVDKASGNLLPMILDNLQMFAEKPKVKSSDIVQGNRSWATGTRPPNLSPEGAGRKGAFNEAKRHSGIPTSQSPDRVEPNFDRRGRRQPGRIYEFDQIQNGRKNTITIRDDAGGHIYLDDPSQNRGPHFNDMEGNHYDY